jgi:signal transduction histidine kinase
MQKDAGEIQAVLARLAAQAGASNPSLQEALEAAIRLIVRLDQENHELQRGVFQLESDPAVCVSELFSPQHGDVSASSVRPETDAFLLHQHILHNLSDGITVQDRDFNIIYQNSAMQRSFGCHLGEKCYVVYEKRSAPCEGCGLAKAFQSGEPNLVLRTAFAADGTTSFWENACFPIFDRQRNIIAGVEVCRNVSTRVSLEQTVKDRNIQLAQLNEELKQQTATLAETLRQREQAEQELRAEMERRESVERLLRHAQKLKAVGQLAAGIAHEINTPAQFAAHNVGFLRSGFDGLQAVLAEYRHALASLSAAPGYEQVLERVTAAEAAADLAFLEQNVPAAFTDALDGLERISTIVQAMKEFGNADRQEKSLIDLNQALQVTLTIARTEYAPVADIETDFQPLPPVMCHQGDMNQVFLNLLVNAAHAIAEMVGQGGRKGVIRLRTAHEGRWVRIDIQDTGCGIAPEIQERLFEPFFTTKEVGRGSGQGLAIAYSLVVDKHGGSLSFASEVGRGTTFTIRLPVAAPVLPAAEGQNVLQSAASASAAPA